MDVEAEEEERKRRIEKKEEHQRARNEIKSPVIVVTDTNKQLLNRTPAVVLDNAHPSEKAEVTALEDDEARAKEEGEEERKRGGVGTEKERRRGSLKNFMGDTKHHLTKPLRPGRFLCFFYCCCFLVGT